MDSVTGTINVTFNSSSSTGLAKRVTLNEGVKIEDFLADQNQSLEHVLIRVNRENAPEGYILRDNDRITATIAGIKGS